MKVSEHVLLEFLLNFDSELEEEVMETYVFRNSLKRTRKPVPRPMFLFPLPSHRTGPGLRPVCQVLENFNFVSVTVPGL